MGQIVLYLQLFFIAASGVGVTFWIGRSIANLIWCAEVERVMMASLFRSFNSFRFGFALLIPLLTAYPINELLASNDIFRVAGFVIMALCLGTSGFIFFGLGKSESLFNYHKASTSVGFYQGEGLAGREFSYQIMMDQIISTNCFKNLTSNELQHIASTVFNHRFDQIMTFEWFDRELNASKSEHSVGRLVARSFQRDIKALLKAIQIKIDGVEMSAQLRFEISSLLQKHQHLKFDDTRGVHYDELIVLNHVDEIVAMQFSAASSNNGSILELERYGPDDKLGFNVSESIGEDRRNFADPIAQEAILMSANATGKAISQLEGKQSTTQIELENCTRDECIDFYLIYLQRRLKVAMTGDNIADAKKLFKDHFIEKGKRRYQTATSDYHDRRFFKENRSSIYLTFGAMVDKFGKKEIEKIKVAYMLVENFPECFPKVKTVLNYLSNRERKV